MGVEWESKETSILISWGERTTPYKPDESNRGNEAGREDLGEWRGPISHRQIPIIYGTEANTLDHLFLFRTPVSLIFSASCPFSKNSGNQVFFPCSFPMGTTLRRPFNGTIDGYLCTPFMRRYGSTTLNPTAASHAKTLHPERSPSPIWISVIAASYSPYRFGSIPHTMLRLFAHYARSVNVR